jgi:hypothetical protein
MSAAGTIESALLQLSRLLEPLEQELSPAQARQTLASLGIVLSPANVTGISSSLQGVVGNTRDLLTIAAALTDAIDDENYGAIAQQGLGAIQKIIGVIQSFDSLVTSVQGVGIPAATAQKIPERLFNYLLIRFAEKAKGIPELLELLGILEKAYFNEGSVDPNNPPYTVSTLNFDRIADWFQDPLAVMKDMYDWGENSFTGELLLQRIAKFLAMTGAPALFDNSGATPVLDLVLASITPKTTDPQGLIFALNNTFNTGTVSFGGDTYKVELELGFTLPFNANATLLEDGSFDFNMGDSGTYSGDVILRFIGDRSTAENGFILLGQAGGSRLEIKKFFVETGGSFSGSTGSGVTNGSFSIGGGVEGGKLHVGFENLDGFLGSVLSGVTLDSDFEFSFGYSTENGLYFIGSSTIEIQIPLHLALGPVELSALTLSVGIEDGKFPVGLGIDIKAELGPLKAVVERIGLKADIVMKEDRSGNLGAVDLQLGFLPPRGVGLSLDVGVVKGGGYLYLDYDKGEYAGAMELSIAEIVTVKAIGLINTKMPDGSPGFSLLIIISAEFTPIQLGFGFTLNGVGGLLGLNRTVVLQALRDGVRTGAINSILFPTDIVANAPQIISNLKTIFPIEQDHFLIGPMAKFGWGTPTLISLSFGLIIEIPGSIAILGVLRINIPTEEAALILIQVNFVGTLDFDAKMLTFDASLFESRILFMTLEGDMAVRLSWGDDPQFLISVGGFHPSFTPPPLALPTLRRLAINILNYDWARIRVEAYFAVTSNTVQFGVAAMLFFGFDAFNVSGDIGFDCLFRFSPFYFIIEVRGSMSLKVFGVDCLSVRLRFSLEGPSPWRAKGTGSVSILFWDIEVDFDVTWGDPANTTLPPIDIMPLFLEELESDSNWKAELPSGSNLMVSLRELSLEADTLIMHPAGTLTVSQRFVPLAFTLERVGTQEPTDYVKLDITAAKSGAINLGMTTVKENFAPAQYEDMTDTEKLSRPSFEKMKGGTTASISGTAMQTGKLVVRTIEYELSTIDRTPNPIKFLTALIAALGTLFSPFFRNNSAAQSVLSAQTKQLLVPVNDRIKAGNEGFVVADSGTNKAFNAQATFGSHAEALQYMQSTTAANPKLKDSLHVIPQYEMMTP